MKVAILQPHYLPYIGAFNLMSQVDAWVFYDDVQLEHQSWQTRNRIKTGEGKSSWLSVPVKRGFGQKINEVQVINQLWREKHWKTIAQSYGKARCFEEVANSMQDLVLGEWIYLADNNIYQMKYLAECLGINPKFYKSSEMKLSGNKTDRVLAVLKILNADEYISGVAAKNYIEEDKFKEVKLTWFEYKCPEYPQLYGKFMPNLSVIDLIFNTGEKAGDYIRG